MEREIYIENGPLESRPGVFLIGSPKVGKRTILSRLLSIDIPDESDLSGGIFCQGWTIQTKYYSADISLWTAHLTHDFSFGTLPMSKQLAGLVMVFDMSDESSFLALKSWVGSIDLEKFEILLCIGNKVDLVPGHRAHSEYRRYLQKRGESSVDPHPEFWDFGIDETEGFSLLRDEEPSIEIRNSCLEWCIQYNIEYIEACASNADFDKCLSVDGDIQGVQRLVGALSAHMWPGMVMKSGDTLSAPSPVNNEEEITDDDESDYEIEYEVLSRGSDEPWEFVGVSGNDLPSTSEEVGSTEQVTTENFQDVKLEKSGDDEARVDISAIEASSSALASRSTDLSSETGISEDKVRVNHLDDRTSKAEARENTNDSDEDSNLYGHEDMERLMCEIDGMRDNLRLMPDFQRREMAAKLAMKMASMFEYSSDENAN